MLSIRELTVADKLAGEIESIADVMDLVGDSLSGAARLWLSSRSLRRSTGDFFERFKNAVARASANPSPEEIDPDDYLADQVLALQRLLHRAVDRVRAINERPLSWPVRWLDRGSIRNLIAAHENLGDARLLVMEHDADCSPILDDVFESPDDLLRMIDKDAA